MSIYQSRTGVCLLQNVAFLLHATIQNSHPSFSYIVFMKQRFLIPTWFLLIGNSVKGEAQFWKTLNSRSISRNNIKKPFSVTRFVLSCIFFRYLKKKEKTSIRPLSYDVTYLGLPRYNMFLQKTGNLRSISIGIRMSLLILHSNWIRLFTLVDRAR